MQYTYLGLGDDFNLFPSAKGRVQKKINYWKFILGPDPPPVMEKNFNFFSETRPFFENFL